MSDFAAHIEDEWERAFQVRDERALKRAGSLICERFVDRATYTHDVSEIRSDIRVLAEMMKLGFEQIDKRFEHVDKRIEQVDKRIDQIDKRIEQVDKRIDQIDKRIDQIDKRIDQVDRRIDQIDRRFEVLIDQMDRRFADVQRGMARHTTTVLWAGAFLLTFLTTLMSVYKFVQVG